MMPEKTLDSFETRSRLSVDDIAYQIHRLDRIDGSARLPFSLKVLLENLLRNEDGQLVTAGHVSTLAAWDPAAAHGREIAFTPARVLMQDFTGVPCVVDLVAMRDAITNLGGDPRRINPLCPTELVIDHSVIADVFGRADAFRINAELEFRRNAERYQLLRWAQQAFADFSVVPPDTGICHQVNLGTWRGWCSAATHRMAHWPIRTRWWAPTRTPRWSTAWLCWVGVWVASRPRRRCWASR